MTAYEFHGDYWHGNPNTIHRTPKVAEIRYKMTVERENILQYTWYLSDIYVGR